MGKKKPFIDKKKSSTYHLLHRSHRDVSQHIFLEEGDTDAAGFILWPAAGNNPTTDQAVLGANSREDADENNNSKRDSRMEEWRERLKESDLLDDNNEREHYTKEISGSGVYLTASGQIATAFGPQHRTAASSVVDIDMLEVKDQIDNIPLREALDEDIAAILYGDTDEIDFEQFEELNDDFVLDAAKPIEKEEGAFDYDAHILSLMEKAKQERNSSTPLSDHPEHSWAAKDRDFFSNAMAVREQDFDEDDSFDHGEYQEEMDGMWTTVEPGAVPKLTPEEEKVLCDKFKETLLEYDSDEIGDNPEEDKEGNLPLVGDTQLESALDEYFQEKDDDVFMQGRTRNPNLVITGGSGYSALVGTRMVPAKLLLDGPNTPNEMVSAEPVESVLAEARNRLAEPPLEPPTDEILIDGQSYFSEKTRNPFDCESILSTYSTLDNNPTTIQATGRKRSRKNKGQSEKHSPLEQIRLSNKTGLPLGVLDHKKDGENGHDDDNEDMATMTTRTVNNKGQARQKQETVEEKKARKAAVKQERQIARIQRAVTRDIYQEEFAKQSIQVGGDAVAGKPLFRYS